MSEPVWTRSQDWVGSEIDDSFVMVNIDSGKYVALNPTASAVWDALEQPRQQSAIEQELVRRFAVSQADCHRSVTSLLEQMQDLQLASRS